MNEFMEEILEALSESWDEHPWVFILGIPLFLGVGITAFFTLGLVGMTLVMTVLVLALACSQRMTLVVAVVIALLLKLLVTPLGALSGIWWTGAHHDQFFQFVRSENLVTLVALVLLPLFVLTVARRAVADTLKVLARHTHTERNTEKTNTTEHTFHR